MNPSRFRTLASWLLTVSPTGHAFAQPSPVPDATAPITTAPVEPAPTTPAPIEPTVDEPAPITPAPSSQAATLPATTIAVTDAPQVHTAPSRATADPKYPQISGTPGNGITLKTADEFSLNVKGRIQLRYQLNISAKDAAGKRSHKQLVTANTARLTLSGVVFKPDLNYFLQLAFAARDYRDGATSQVYDAYFDWKLHRDFSLKAGQFFVPFDRLRTVRESALQLADRARPVQELSLDRDVGVVAYSEKFLDERSPVALRLGAFGGSGANQSTDKKPGALLVARAELRPLGPIDDDSEGDLERRAQPGLAIGAAVAEDLHTNRQKATTGLTFTGGTTNYTQAALDLAFKWQGAALLAEYLWRDTSKDQILSVDTLGMPVVEPTRSGSGWVLQASYVLNPPVEFVARVSKLNAKKGTDPAFIKEVASKGNELAAGVNYYLNGHKLKLQTDWIARMPPGFVLGKADHLVHFLVDGTF